MTLANPGAIEKFPLEMSKKMLSAACTFTRAEAVEIFGNETVAAPALGTLDARRNGKV